MSALPDHESPPELPLSERQGAPTRLRERLREQTHAAILDAAERTVTEDGTALARIDAIAVAAGVSVGTLYNHFADRDALVVAVVQDRRRALLGRVTALVEASDLDFVSKLQAFFEVFAETGARHGAFFAVVMGEQSGSRPWQCQRNETQAAVTELSRRLLEQGVREGIVRWDRLDANTMFLTVLAKVAIVGTIARMPPIATADMTHFFLHGVSPTSPDVRASDRSSK